MESITNSNNYTNIQKNLKSFLDVPIWTRRSCLIKTTGDKKSDDTVPLMLHIFRANSRIFKYVLIKSAAIATGQNKLGDPKRKDQLLSS
jgi:hypothetical protein